MRSELESMASSGFKLFLFAVCGLGGHGVPLSLEPGPSLPPCPPQPWLAIGFLFCGLRSRGSGFEIPGLVRRGGLASGTVQPSCDVCTASLAWAFCSTHCLLLSSSFETMGLAAVLGNWSIE